jgi:hypothetical protein
MPPCSRRFRAGPSPLLCQIRLIRDGDKSNSRLKPPRHGYDSPTRTAFLILPDRSHAKAICLGHSCQIEPFAAEKRVVVPCDFPKGDASKYAHCYQPESYEADRKGNDITFETVSGKVTYRIVGPW